MKKQLILLTTIFLITGCSQTTLDHPTTLPPDHNTDTQPTDQTIISTNTDNYNGVIEQWNNSETKTNQELNLDSDPQPQTIPGSNTQTAEQQDNIEIKDTATKTHEDIYNIPLTVKVGSEEYFTSVSKNTSVYGAMQILTAMSVKPFYFVAKEYPGMGFFVEEINGVKNDNRAGLYWIYYINGESAKIGISNYIIQPEDIITWEYEKSTF